MTDDTEVKEVGDISPPGWVGEKQMIVKTDTTGGQKKSALRSKKFIAFLLSVTVFSALLVLGHVYGPVDVWTQRLIAGALGVVSVGYILGVAALDAILGNVFK